MRVARLDRTIPECLQHARIQAADERERYLNAIANLRYDPTAFFSPPWPEIYTNDEERRHTFEQGLANHREALAGYIDSGYVLVEIPRTSIGRRTDFILERIREHATGYSNGDVDETT